MSVGRLVRQLVCRSETFVKKIPLEYTYKTVVTVVKIVTVVTVVTVVKVVTLVTVVTVVTVVTIVTKKLFSQQKFLTKKLFFFTDSVFPKKMLTKKIVMKL